MSHGSEKRVRDEPLTIRFSSDERAIIKAAADRAGLTEGSYVRQVLMGAPTPRQVRRPPVERRELVRLLGALGHVGGNLNQLAHTANTLRPIDRRELATSLTDLRTVRDAIMTALGRAP